jgi:RsiW-degrading membrane proteinase PrsW (M82 family)/pterin-4a-carbinolamine dehydratase
MIVLLSIVAAILPTLFFVALIYSVDRYEREPAWLLAATFIWGAVPSIIAAFLFNSGLSLPFYLISTGLGDMVGGALIAPVVEESLKGFALIGIFLFWRQELDSHLDGIIYGAMVGMGFGMVENVFYFLTVYNESGVEAWGVNIFMRAILFGLNHALFTSVFGLGIAAARLTTHRNLGFIFVISGWISAVMLHTIHNFSATLGGPFVLFLFLSDFGGVILVFLIIVWALWQEGRWIEEYLVEETALGVLTTRQHQTATSVWGRLGKDFELLLSGGFKSYRTGVKFYDRCAELAYKKHHHALFAHARDLNRIEELRQEIAGLSHEVK